MLKTRRLPRLMVLRWAIPTLLKSGAWAAMVYAAYVHGGLLWLRVPFLPIATVGTAVAFYVGFKNNSAYDRFWEGRKIWGGVVNASRTWANAVMSYIEPDDESEDARAMRKELIYRHIAWINAVRLQLRRTSRFFDNPHPTTRKRLERHKDAMRNDWDRELSGFLAPDEMTTMSAYANTATQLLVAQGKRLASLLTNKRMDLFHQIAMMDVIEELYALQGKAERIKHTPFPRQYAEFSRIFTRLFVVVLPFGMLDIFAEHVDQALSLHSMLMVVPMLVANAVVTWVFVTMEGIGDSSEDPFERSMNDVPMNALCRTIEIDLREMLGETDLPAAEPVHDRILY